MNIPSRVKVVSRRIRPCAVLAMIAALSCLSSAGQTSAAPLLLPQPREIDVTGRIPFHSVGTSVPGGDAEDLFAAQNLSINLAVDGVLVDPSAGGVDLGVILLRDGTPEAHALLDQNHLRFTAAMEKEGYVLISQRTAEGHARVTIVGHTSAGVFYGVQTLKQLVSKGDKTELWLGTVRDWPAMQFRGVHDDLSRGPVPTLAFQKHQMDVFAAYKVNLYSPYFEHTLQYANDPLAAPPGGSLTRAESRELEAYATRLHILIVPEQEAFGHLHHVLQLEKYSDLAETPHGHVIAPGQPGSQPIIKSWFSQIAEDFPSPFLHIGADETFELGTGRTKEDVEKRGLGPVYADFLTQIHGTLAPLYRRLLFWGDIAESDPAAIPGLPKDMIAIPWVYYNKDSYDNDILPFKNAGIETWVAPGDANWRVVYPIGKTALDNIAGFVASGQRLGSTGVLTTVWDDDGEGLFNQDWFGVLFGAAAGWQPGKSDGEAYRKTFGTLFYGDSSGRIDRAQSELMASEDLIDVSDTTFWMDPWSPEGIAKGAKMRAKIPEARLHAEKAIELILLERAVNPNLSEKDALAAMELGARRIDFIGAKFQLADEMRSAYAKALTLPKDEKHESETHEVLYSISSMNGRCQDLRDGYSLLKVLYRDSWLAENRPYWLDNVLVRYDLQIQKWQQRGDDFNALIDRWRDTEALPTFDKAGIPPPDPQ